MKPCVAPAMLVFTKAREGAMLAFYLDVKKLVTIGWGMLMAQWSDVLASGLVFVNDDGPATLSETCAAWTAVHLNTSLDPRKGGVQYAKLTDIRATQDSVDAFFLRELADKAATLTKYLPNFPDAPADAQFAALSHAWAFGAAFPPKWPHWTACFIAGDWNGCADQDVPSAAEMAVQNASFHARIATEQERLRLAATCADPDQLSDLPVAA